MPPPLKKTDLVLHNFFNFVLFQHEAITSSKEITIPGGSVFVNPSVGEEGARYVTIETTKEAPKGSIGELGKEVDEILTRSSD